MNTQARADEEFLRELAAKIGHDEFGLQESTFAIRMWSDRDGKGFQVERGKSITRIYFSISPMDDVDDLFILSLKRALKTVKWIRDTNRTDVVIHDGLHVSRKDVPSAYRELYRLPPLIDRDQVDVEIHYKVVVKHKVTGIVVEKCAPVSPVKNGGARITRLIDEAREEITEQVIEFVKRMEEAAGQSTPSDPKDL